MRWTDEEVALIRAAYATPPPLRLDALAALLGRDKANVCRKARALGLTNQRRKKVVRRKDAPMFDDPAELSAHRSTCAKRQIAEHGHPRGALGMTHTVEARAKLSAKHRANWADPASAYNSEANRQRRSDVMLARNLSGEMRVRYSRGSQGRRPDLDNRYFRSSWEANYARYLNLMIRKGELRCWDYECKTFVFEKIKRGTRAYTPDFLLTFSDGRQEWHEVKGWMDPKSATRMKRMSKFYPAEVVRIIGADWFKAANRGGLASVIQGWERGGKRNVTPVISVRDMPSGPLTAGG